MTKNQVVLNIDEAIDQELIRISQDKTVLDLGGYRGRECKLALNAGARSAICVDDESWRTYDRWPDTPVFEGVEYVQDNFMSYISPAEIVILKNVIYHQRNPWRTLEHVRILTKETLILATSYIEGEEPMWMVYKPREGHPMSYTVAWRPTKLGLVKLLEATGFKNIRFLKENDQGSLALVAEVGELPEGFGERN